MAPVAAGEKLVGGRGSVERRKNLDETAIVVFAFVYHNSIDVTPYSKVRVTSFKTSRLGGPRSIPVGSHAKFCMHMHEIMKYFLFIVLYGTVHDFDGSEICQIGDREPTGERT